MSVCTIDSLRTEIAILSKRLDQAKKELAEAEKYTITKKDIRAGVRISYGFGGEVMTLIEDSKTGMYHFGGVGGNPFITYNGNWRTKEEMFVYVKDNHVLVIAKE